MPEIPAPITSLSESNVHGAMEHWQYERIEQEVTTMVGPARQCPRCELRFLDQPELEDHLRTEHGLAHVTHVFETALEDPIPR